MESWEDPEEEESKQSGLQGMIATMSCMMQPISCMPQRHRND